MRELTSRISASRAFSYSFFPLSSLTFLVASSNRVLSWSFLDFKTVSRELFRAVD